MSNYGIDFALLQTTDAAGNTSLDVDLFTVLDGDPKVVQAADLARIFANPGDYDWDPEYTTGAGLLDLRGKSVSKKDIDTKKRLIDNMSLADERISGSFTELSLVNGTLLLVHNISVVDDIVYNTNIQLGK